MLRRIEGSSDSRSVLVKKNIAYGLLIKGLSVLCNLLIVPLTIHYLNPTRYGIWLTVSSVAGWIGLFDIGLSQGLRNRFAEARSNGDDESARSYVSTTYFILAVLFLIVWIVLFTAGHWVDWGKLLNLNEGDAKEVSVLALIVITYLCILFVLKVIGSILVADQRGYLSNFLDLGGQLVALFLIFLVAQGDGNSLILLGLVFCCAPILVYAIGTIAYFRNAYREYKPSWRFVKLERAKGLVTVGVVFFIIQVANVVQYESANIIIVREFGGSDVTNFNIVYKYFAPVNILNMVFLAPFWSASTEAYLKGDLNWIKNSIRKYNYLNFTLILAAAVMLLVSGTVYGLWIGKGVVNIDPKISFYGFVFFSLSMFGGKYVSFLNGISALRIQLISCLFSPILYVAVLMILIRRFGFGVEAVFIAAIMANFNTYLIAPIQYHKIVNRGAAGIWIR